MSGGITLRVGIELNAAAGQGDPICDVALHSVSLGDAWVNPGLNLAVQNERNNLVLNLGVCRYNCSVCLVLLDHRDYS